MKMIKFEVGDVVEVNGMYPNEEWAGTRGVVIVPSVSAKGYEDYCLVRTLSGQEFYFFKGHLQKIG